MGNVLEVVKTHRVIYIGYVIEENALTFDEDGNDIECIILSPDNDEETEVWVPIKNIKYRSEFKNGV